MMGLFNTGEVPFTNVFIHGKILDGNGITMSKSKGNGIDPLEIIESYGADAMRFSLAQMTTESQDMRMPVKKDQEGKNISEKFDIGRNFCNKLWNASRFALGNLEEMPTARFERDDLQLEDRWILSRLRQTVAATTNQLDEFKFSEPISAIYRFFWNDLCDWYLEIIKPRMRDDTQRGIAQQVLAFAFDATLRLLHPFMPFITEEIFHKLNVVCPQRDLGGLADMPSSENLITAAWPGAPEGLIDEGAEQHMRLLQNTIRSIREIRTRYKVPPRNALVASVKASDENCSLLERYQHIICNLVNLDQLQPSPDAAKPNDAAVVLLDDLEIYVYGVIDVEAERKRLVEQRTELANHIERTLNKLNNEAFVTRAKPEVVQRERDRLTQLQEQLQNVDKNLKDLPCAS